jgi:hypothetical protein
LKLITHNRKNRGMRRDSALGLFAAVWFSLAVQPCAMALEADHDCPHCPPSHDQEMAMHHGHHEAEPPCASLQAPCGDIDDASLDGRVGKLKAKHSADVPVLITPDIADVTARLYRQIYPPTGPPGPYGNGPALNVLYCVYLK